MDIILYFVTKFKHHDLIVNVEKIKKNELFDFFS